MSWEIWDTLTRYDVYLSFKTRVDFHRLHNNMALIFITQTLSHWLVCDVPQMHLTVLRLLNYVRLKNIVQPRTIQIPMSSRTRTNILLVLLKNISRCTPLMHLSQGEHPIFKNSLFWISQLYAMNVSFRVPTFYLYQQVLAHSTYCAPWVHYHIWRWSIQS